jgi:hypothetical protein
MLHRGGKFKNEEYRKEALEKGLRNSPANLCKQWGDLTEDLRLK